MLTPKPSRAAWLWWGALHLLLAAAALLVAWPWPVRVLVWIAIVGHGIARRPRRPPPTIVVGADGRCAVPQWQMAELPLGAGTLVCPYWVRLGFGTGPRQCDIVLFIDQLDRRQWALLRACLLRLRCV